MKIRHATLADAAAISDFVSELTSAYIAPSLGSGGIEQLLVNMGHDSTRQRMADGWPHVCAHDGNGLLGVVVVKPPAHLYHLFVRADLHRTGIGARLFSIADDWCLNASDTRLATVNSSLNAVQAYRRLGFDTDGPVVETGGVRHQPMVRRSAG